MERRVAPGVMMLIAIVVAPLWHINFFGVNFGIVELCTFSSLIFIFFCNFNTKLPKKYVLGGVLFSIFSGVSLINTPNIIGGVLDWFQWIFILLIMVPMGIWAFQNDRILSLSLIGVTVSTGTITIVTAIVSLLNGTLKTAVWYGNFNQPYWIAAVFGICLLGFALDTQYKLILRISAGLSSLLVAVLVVFSPAQSGLLLLIGGGSTFTLSTLRRLNTNKLFRFALGTTVLGIITFPVVALITANIWTKLDVFRNRLPMYELALIVGLQNQPFGTGLGSSAVVLDSLPPGVARSVHNFILHFWLETGVFGLVAFGIIGYSWINGPLRVFILKPDRVPVRFFIPTAVISGYILVALVQPPPVRRLWWLFFAASWAATMRVDDNPLDRSQNSGNRL